MVQDKLTAGGRILLVTCLAAMVAAVVALGAVAATHTFQVNQTEPLEGGGPPGNRFMQPAIAVTSDGELVFVWAERPGDVWRADIWYCGDFDTNANLLDPDDFGPCASSNVGTSGVRGILLQRFSSADGTLYEPCTSGSGYSDWELSALRDPADELFTLPSLAAQRGGSNYRTAWGLAATEVFQTLYPYISDPGTTGFDEVPPEWVGLSLFMGSEFSVAYSEDQSLLAWVDDCDPDGDTVKYVKGTGEVQELASSNGIGTCANIYRPCAAASDDKFFVAWDQLKPIGTCGQDAVVVAEIGSGDPVYRVVTSLQEDHVAAAAVAALDDGSFVVAWQDDPPDTTSPPVTYYPIIYLRRYSADSQNPGWVDANPVRVTLDTYHHDITRIRWDTLGLAARGNEMDQDARIAVVWESVQAPDGDDHIYWQLYDGVSTDGLLDTPAKVTRCHDDDVVGTDWNPLRNLGAPGQHTAAFLPNGKLAVAWVGEEDRDRIYCTVTSSPTTPADCNSNGVDDECDIGAGTSEDCNTNGVPDECDIAGTTSDDCNTNAVPDECDIAGTTSDDCNTNGVPDECDINCGTSQDTNTNGIPDECQRVITAARSCMDHDGTEWCLDVSTSGASYPYHNIEPRLRLGAPTEIEFDLNLAPWGAVTASVECTTSGHTDTGEVESNGSTIRVTFDPPLPDQNCCEITLGGYANDTHLIAMLEADVNRDRSVTTVDTSAIKARLGQSVNDNNFWYDLYRNGWIDTPDKSAATARLGNGAPACPN